MTVYITGSSGFIGSHFAHYVSEHGRDAEIVPLDIALQGQDLFSILRVLEHAGPEDLVVLLGAQPEVAKFAKAPQLDVDINVEPVVAQMHAAKNAKLIILASSFGGLFTRQTRPVSIEERPWPGSAYFAGKLALEGYLHAQHRTEGTAYRVARFANVYGGRGPGQLSQWRGVIPDWMQRRREGRPFDVWGDLEATRDYVWVLDVCNALWRLWQQGERREMTTKGVTVHVGTGVLTSLKDLGMAIAEAEPLLLPEREERPEPAFTFEESRPGYTTAGSPVDLDETKQLLASVSLGMRDVWDPLSLHSGLQQTWAAYLAEGRE
jgi:UDP-glucose 4-epimerase